MSCVVQAMIFRTFPRRHPFEHDVFKQFKCSAHERFKCRFNHFHYAQICVVCGTRAAHATRMGASTCIGRVFFHNNNSPITEVYICGTVKRVTNESDSKTIFARGLRYVHSLSQRLGTGLINRARVVLLSALGRRRRP